MLQELAITSISDVTVLFFKKISIDAFLWNFATY